MIRTALIVTSLVGAGLEAEARLLKAVLESHDVKVFLLHYTDMATYVGPVDVMFSLEVVMPRSLGLAERNYLFPNSEWWPSQNDQYLPRFHKILCKTQDCFEIWSRKVGMDRCAFTSFEAHDLYLGPMLKSNTFLHVAGKNERRGTEAVLNCWAQHQDLPPLTVVGTVPAIKNFETNHRGWQGVVTRDKVPFETLRHLMNCHKYHIIPSEYEGFGHALHEGLSCNAQVLTTDAPPMNQFDGIMRAGLVSVVQKIPASLAVLNKVSADSVYSAVQNLLHSVVFDEEAPRNAFLSNRSFFRQTFWDEISQ